MSRSYQHLLASSAVVLALLFCTHEARAGTLFVGSDTEDFSGVPSAAFPTDRLVKATVTGAVFNSQITIPLGNLPTGAPILLNGLADGGGFLYAGTPSQNLLERLDFDGNLIGFINAPGIPNGGCCNEEMLLVPQAGGGANFYHVHYSDAITQIDPVTGALIATFAQSDVVGMALVGNTIWISKWLERQVGTWDPSTNTFTPVFSTPTNAGALAYDPDNSIMWVGRQGGTVEPYDLTGVLLGGGFQPFGDIPDTIDGLTFLGEVTRVPEPGTIALLGAAFAGLGLLRRRRLH
jgi:PEP-CTERM motif